MFLVAQPLKKYSIFRPNFSFLTPLEILSLKCNKKTVQNCSKQLEHLTLLNINFNLKKSKEKTFAIKQRNKQEIQQ